MTMDFDLRGFTVKNILCRLRFWPAALGDAIALTCQLKRTFDEGRPISEALTTFAADREEGKE